MKTVAGQNSKLHTGVFDSDEVLEITLSGNIRALFSDRSDNAPYHPITLTYQNPDNTTTRFRLKAKTRGNFRRARGNCIYPPILLNFQGKESVSTIFHDQDKVKLVMPCRNEDYVIREYLVYKLYNLITPLSFRARLLRTTFIDTVRNKETTFYGILLEEDEQMARRNELMIIKQQNLKTEKLRMKPFLTMAMFQYMIGNTDWSLPFLHNTRVLAEDSISIHSAVPYDFDHSGIVNASYAYPAEALNLASTRVRRYRGHCVSDIKEFDDVVAQFNVLKPDIYRVYTECKLLDKSYIIKTTKFLDDFFNTINNQKKFREEVTYPCDPKNPNIVIKGLKD